MNPLVSQQFSQKVNALHSPQKQQAVAQTVRVAFGQQFQQTYDNSKPKSQGSFDVTVGDTGIKGSTNKAVSQKFQAVPALEVSPFVAFSQLMVRIQQAVLKSKHQAVETAIQKQASSPLQHGGVLA